MSKRAEGLGMPLDAEDNPVPVLSPIGDPQDIDIDSSGAVSNAFPSGCKIVRLVGTVDCKFKIGPDPDTANPKMMYLPAKVVEYLRIKEGDKIGVVLVDDSGSLNITPMG